MANRLDEAFNWLVLILTIIAGTLAQFPEIFPFLFLGNEPNPMGTTVGLVRLLVFPVIGLVLTWLWGYLAEETQNQIVLKSLSWMLATIILLHFLVFMIWAVYSPGPPPNVTPDPITLALAALAFLSPLYLSLHFFLFAIRARMRKRYEGSKFLSSLGKQVSLYVVAIALFYVCNGQIEVWLRYVIDRL